MPVCLYNYKFKKGEHYHLDDIYDIQGIGGNDWWEVRDVADEEYVNDDNIVITKNIDITIQIKTY